ncbi:MAG: hypothetical protein AAFR96_02985 [Planctomycetota bacterium]
MQSPLCHATALALALSVVAQASGQIAPGQDPELTSDAAEREGRRLLRDDPAEADPAKPNEAAAITPVRVHHPLRTPGPGRLLPEGSFVVEQPAKLRRTASGAWVAQTRQTESFPAVRPMIVLPSQSLGRIARLAGDEPSLDATLTGRVTLFRNQNYLLVTSISDADDSSSENADAAPQPASEEPPADSQVDRLSDPVTDLVRELESERTGIRGVISGLGSTGDEAIAPVAEGRTIARRRARLVRLDAGELALRFDSDATESPLDAPLVIAPCALLEDVESTVEIHGDAMTATVSGQTLAFAGRSFILPISIVLDRPAELTTRQ